MAVIFFGFRVFNRETNGWEVRYVFSLNEWGVPAVAFRWSATSFRETSRGKQFVFVGDSLARNEFDSLLCMALWGLEAKEWNEVRSEKKRKKNP